MLECKLDGQEPDVGIRNLGAICRILIDGVVAGVIAAGLGALRTGQLAGSRIMVDRGIGRVGSECFPPIY